MTTLDDLVARLHDEGRLRVWSLAVTFFGDAVAPRGGAVAMGALIDALARLGAEPGAVRTAMSRLARDGWVERTKAGRKSYYRLAGPGEDASRAAAARIYAAAPPEWDKRWTVAIEAPGAGAAALRDAGFHRVAPGAWIAPGDAAAPEQDGVFTIAGGVGDPPLWARAAMSPPALAARYSALIGAWEAFDAGALASDPEAAIAARTLLIHDWRRTLLRDAPLPRALRPTDWPGAAARDLVAEHYRALTPAAERWLDGREAAPGTPLPPPVSDFAARFGGL